MSLLDTALRFAEYKPQPFVAPIPTNGWVEVFTIQNGVPLRYTMHNQIPGWWELTPKGRKITVTSRAFVTDTMKYLDNLPRFYVIACVPSGEHTWLVVPYNASDASQRGWTNGEPKQMYLVSEEVQPFDVMIARSMAGVLLYDILDFRLGEFTKSSLCRELAEKKSAAPNERDWRNAYNIVTQWMLKAEQELRAKRISDKLAETQDRMKFMLEFMGAKLIESEKKGNGYLVTWEAPDGHKYKMGVREDGRISVAGFCLAGTDNQHNLSSIVQVMSEAHRQHRPDVNQAYADYEREDDDDD